MEEDVIRYIPKECEGCVADHFWKGKLITQYYTRCTECYNFRKRVSPRIIDSFKAVFYTKKRMT